MVQTYVTKIARQFPLYCVDFARLYSCQAEDFSAHFRISSEKNSPMSRYRRPEDFLPH